jgi:hypothetical protein
MTMKTVLTLMAAAGILLLGYTFNLHEHVLSADEAEVQRACRHLCRLNVSTFTGKPSGALGTLTDVMVGAACESLEDEAPQLSGCRERLLGQDVSVATYRCVMGASSSAAAKTCGDGIP